MKLCVGTSGYSYKEWKGAFYPEDLPAKDMLRFYSERLPAVEINNTFYRMPKVSVLESWAEQVPEGFHFSLKASRRITHIKRLKDAGEELEFLLGNSRTLGERLGVILFQLPPYLRKDLPRLDDFLSLLPEGTPATFEFRHSTWFDEEIYGRLRDKKFALCASDTDEEPWTRELGTTNWGYLRLRRGGYSDTDLKDWEERIHAQEWKRAFVFFKHEDEAAGPRLAARFLEIAGGE